MQKADEGFSQRILQEAQDGVVCFIALNEWLPGTERDGLNKC